MGYLEEGDETDFARRGGTTLSRLQSVASITLMMQFSMTLAV
jgi:hypothetical protein